LRCPSPRPFQAYTAKPFAQLKPSLKFPLHPIAPGRPVPNQAEYNRRPGDLLPDNLPHVRGPLTLDGSANAVVMKVEIEPRVQGHEPKAAHLGVIFGMEAQENAAGAGVIGKLPSTGSDELSQ